MTSPDYKQKLGELRERANKYDDNRPAQSGINLNFRKWSKWTIAYYVAPPIAMLILLIIFKPGFLTTSHIDQNNNITEKMDIKKLLIATLVFGAIIDVAIFAYFRKMKQ